jgi:hypothetical protein
MSSQPVNPPIGPLQDHDALRKKSEEKADSILDALDSKSLVSYDYDTLRDLGVLLHLVDLTGDANSNDQEVLDFKLSSKIEYSTYKIDSARIPKHMRHHYDRFDEAFHSSSSWPLSDTELIYENAFQIVRYINILKTTLRKMIPLRWKKTRTGMRSCDFDLCLFSSLLILSFE